MTKWHERILEDAYDFLDQEMSETHPEHGEHDVLRRARDAVEDADIALEKLSSLRRAGWSAVRAYDAATRRAQAGEAGTAETVKQGSVHEHAVRKDAPNK